MESTMFYTQLSRRGRYTLRVTSIIVLKQEINSYMDTNARTDGRTYRRIYRSKHILVNYKCITCVA